MKSSGDEGKKFFYVLVKFGRNPGAPETFRVASYWSHPCYLWKLCAWEAIRLKGDAAECLLTRLLSFLKEESWAEFRLRCLELIYLSKDKSAVPFLYSLLLEEKDPLVLRALVWTLGALGDSSVVEDLLLWASSPAGRIVRREIVGEAVGMALEKTPELETVCLLKNIAHKNKRVAFYLQDLPLKGRKEKFYIYPSPDYLSREAGAGRCNLKSLRRDLSNILGR